MSRSFDHASLRQAFAPPPQQWVSYATVDADTKEAPSCIFEDEDGNPLPYGPMVRVTLQPSGVAMAVRVGMGVAGEGEGDWYPYAGGDEVLVVLPEGNQRGGACIIARMNQEIDTWPTVVAGQKSTENKLGFRRMRAPFILETANAYLIRSATTGSQIGIDAQGQVILNDGDKDSMVLGPEALGFTSGDGESFMTVLPQTKQVFLGGGAATFLLDAAGTKFISEGGIDFATNGGAANGHGVTAEQVVAFVANVVTQLAVFGAFNPLILPPPPSAALIAPIFAAALAAMATPVPTDAIPGGMFGPPWFGTVFGPAGAITAAMSNPLAPIDPTGTIPGFGRGGFRL